MDTIRMLGFEKLETLYETSQTYICRVKNKAGETSLLKVMKDKHPATELLARFEYEYTLLHGLNAPGIIHVHELVRHYNGHVIVMEDEGGTPLVDAPIFKSIQQGVKRFSSDKLQWILDTFIRMAEVVGRLHDSNLIHKDINPANFLLSPNYDRVNILDFSLASLAGSDSRNDSPIEGTLPYIAPEQTGRLDRTVDYRSDFYSLGISMYELISGQKPFTAQDPLEMVHCHIAVVPVSPHTVNPQIPEMVSDIIMRLMDKEPRKRYQSAAGIVQDFGICIEKLRTTGVVGHFKIGMSDLSTEFQIPKKLYGREDESEKLKQLYKQVNNGATMMMLVGGYAGVGKTSFIQEICRPQAEFLGLFTSGKAEQFQRNTPYFVFAQAMKDLVETLIQAPDSELEQWKESLLNALNDNGRLITDIVPELIALIGPQPQVSELGPAENRNRFLYTYGSFIKVFTQKNHPLTLFLDDLQWSDRPSLELIKYLLNRDDLESFMMICSYRDNELTAGHPSHLLLDEFLESENTVAFPLKPLAEEHVADMLADILNQKTGDVRPLARIVYKKTQGNPFFVRKLLRHLHDGGYIRFNGESRRWEWDVNEIEGIGVSDNIVDFMVGQLQKLSPETQDILKLAALVGSSFDLEILAAIANISVSGATSRLLEAIENEIILPIGSEEIATQSLQTVDLNRGLRFAHDRVQQACLALMDAEQQKEGHLHIGRMLKANTPRDMWPESAMDIVSHLNEGLSKIQSDEERWESARLNLWASQKAKASSAFYLALGYIENSARLLPENAWTQDYGFTYTIIKTYVECAYLNNAYAQADEKAEVLLRQARTPMEQAEIRLMQSTMYNFQGQLEKAIQYAILGLQLLKVRVPASPGMPLVFKELASVKAGLLGKSNESLLNLPPIQNERIMLAIHLWTGINNAAYLFGNTNLFLLSLLKRMRLLLRFGNTHEAGNIYVAYALVLAIFGDFTGTYNFCELALLSHDKEKSFETRPTTLFSCGFFGHAWNRSWKEIEQWFEKSMEEAVKYGDHHTIALAGSFMYAFKPDASIKELVAKSMKQYPLVKQTGNELSINFTFLMIHRWLNYAGLTDGRFSMSVSSETLEKNGGAGIVYSEEECLDNLLKGNYLSALGVYYKEKTYIHYLYDDYAGALKYLAESDKYITYHTGTPYIVECRVCNFLVLAANLPTMKKREADKARQRLRKEYSQVKSWAKHCPVNFLHLQYLMEAELACLSNRTTEAADLYDSAIQTARQNGFMRDDALANELAAKMFLKQGKESRGAFYLIEAIKVYKTWGADAKVSHMIEKYGHLLKSFDYREKASETTGETLDLRSIVSASEAVLREAQLPNLLRQIMKIVIENSGAQKGNILLKSEQGWRLVGEWLPGAEEASALPSIPLEEGDGLLPSSVINFCIHTGESVVLGDAMNTGRFCKDPYIRQNQTRSLLCMPILNQGNQEGILYLENNLSADVFTKDRVNILQVLAAQFSISIKNVQLFTNLLAKTEEVHRATENALRSDIAFLQAQIKPHFLFNAINTISAFSYDDPQLTRDLLAKLSEYLRSSFDFKNRDRLVTLRKELEFVEAYLFIEKTRFGDRLKVIYDVDADTDCTLLPPLVIEPLVENAVLHGLSGLKKGGTITISVRNEKDDILITVEDDGAGIEEAALAMLFDESAAGSGGVALKNINQRLTRMYGRGLLVERRTGGGTLCSMCIAK